MDMEQEQITKKQTQEPKNFKDFNIIPEKQGLIGKKIPIRFVLDKEIVVEKFRIKDSKYSEKNNEKCLHLQIIFKDERRVIFTGSGVLMDQILKINEDCLPFKTTIVELNEHYEFT